MSKLIIYVNNLLVFIFFVSFQYSTKKTNHFDTMIIFRDTLPSRGVRVLSIEKENTRIASTGEDLGKQCDKWRLDKSLIEKIFKASHPISSSEHHYLYDVWPCNMKGKILINQDTFSFEVNPGSYMTFWNKDTSFYYGCTDKKYKKYFLSEPWNPKKGE